MLESKSRLCIVSMNDYIPPQTISYLYDWNILDLKNHLSHAYPGQPSVKSQKLICGGRCLDDDMTLSSLFDINPDLCIVLLVVDATLSRMSNSENPQQMIGCNRDDLKEQYSIYLQEYYANAAGDAPDGSSTSKYQPSLESQSSSSSPVPNQPLPAEAPNPEPVEHGNIFNRAVRFLGNQANGDANDVQGEGFDFVEFAYSLLRITLMFTICLAYSSWQRMLTVAAITVAVYWYNNGRQNRLQQQRPLPPHVEPLILPNAPIEAQNQEPGPSISTTNPTNADAPTTLPVVRNEEGVRPFFRIFSFVRLVGLTSFRFFCALMRSLVPNVPENLD